MVHVVFKSNFLPLITRFGAAYVLKHKDQDTWSEYTWPLFSKFSVEWDWVPLPRPPLQDSGGHSGTCMSVHWPHSFVGWHLHLLYLRLVSWKHTLPAWGPRCWWTLQWHYQVSSEDLESVCPSVLRDSQQVSRFSSSWPGDSTLQAETWASPVFLLKMKQTVLQLFTNSLMSKVANFGSAASPHTYLSPMCHLFRLVGYRLEIQLIFHSGPTSSLSLLYVQFGVRHPVGRN